MKVIIKNAYTKNKELVYQEDFWGQNKRITFDCEILSKLDENTFEFVDGENKNVFIVKGNALSGVTINMFDKDVVLTRNLTSTINVVVTELYVSHV